MHMCQTCAELACGWSCSFVSRVFVLCVEHYGCDRYSPVEQNDCICMHNSITPVVTIQYVSDTSKQVRSTVQHC